MVSDLSDQRLGLVSARYPAVQVTNRVQDLLDSPDIDAVAVATPISTHYELAVKALEAGKHVLVEKPLADSSDRCRRLIDLAARKRKVLMVDHTFPYTGAVMKIKCLIDSGTLGKIYYYDSTRINLGLFQHDVSVIWDLAVHDLSICDYLLKQKPAAVSATGISHVKGQPANVAYLTLFFPDDIIGHINVNWLAPVKIRQTLISGSEKMVVYDDNEPTEKVKVYDKGITVKTSPENIYRMRVSYRAGDMLAPQLDGMEALKRLSEHFVECITTGATPKTDAESGLRVVKVMEAATESLAQRGKLITIA
jgi:predicted dehydrogenase